MALAERGIRIPWTAKQRPVAYPARLRIRDDGKPRSHIAAASAARPFARVSAVVTLGASRGLAAMLPLRGPAGFCWRLCL